MIKFILSITLSLSILFSFSATGTILKYPVPNVGLTTTIPNVTPLPDVIYVYPSESGVLSGNISLAFSGNPPKGTMIRVIVEGFTLGAQTVTVLGEVFQDYMVSINHAWVVTFFYTDNAGAYIKYNQPSTLAPNLGAGVIRTLDGDIIVSGTLPLSALAAPITPSDLDTVGEGRILVGNSSDELASKFFGTNGYIGIGDGTTFNSVAQTGDVIFSNAGVSAIQAGVIVNADINASAAIARTKLASGNASYVVVNSGAGVMTEEQFLSASRGGNAIDNSGATGFPVWSGGTQSVGAISDIIPLEVSFESGYIGDFKITMPFSGTVTGIYAYATKAIAATSNGTIQMKNNAGTSTTNGLITFVASDARGTAYSVSPSSANTFVANDILTFTTAKADAGGVVQLSILVSRTQ